MVADLVGIPYFFVDPSPRYQPVRSNYLHENENDGLRLKKRRERGEVITRCTSPLRMTDRTRAFFHFIEWIASLFPSVSSYCAMNPYCPMAVFGMSVVPPFAVILRKASWISSTLKYTTVPA